MCPSLETPNLEQSCFRLQNPPLHKFLRTPLVERHVKMVTEATAQVEGFERRDGLIRQKIKFRKLLKKFDTKVQF